MSDVCREFITKPVFVDCLSGWQIVPHCAVNTNFSAIEWHENETASYAMHGVMVTRFPVPKNRALQTGNMFPTSMDKSQCAKQNMLHPAASVR